MKNLAIGTLWRDRNLRSVGVLKKIYPDGRMEIEFPNGGFFNYYREELEEVFLCDCGEPSTQSETISTMPGSLDTKFVRVHFCDKCYAEFHQYDEYLKDDTNQTEMNEIHPLNPLERLWNSTADLYKRFNLDAPIFDRLTKFREEVSEFEEEIRAFEYGNGSGDALIEEAADVFVTTLGILQKFKVDIDDLMEKIELVALKNDAKTHETHVIWNGLITKRSKIQKELKTHEENNANS